MLPEATPPEQDSEGYTKLVPVEAVTPDEMVQVVFDDWEVEVGIALVDGMYYTFRDVCPHMNFPLTVGRLKGSVLTCAGHLWRFDFKQGGRAFYPPINKSITFWPNTVHDGYIWVKIPDR